MYDVLRYVYRYLLLNSTTMYRYNTCSKSGWHCACSHLLMMIILTHKKSRAKIVFAETTEKMITSSIIKPGYSSNIIRFPLSRIDVPYSRMLLIC